MKMCLKLLCLIVMFLAGAIAGREVGGTTSCPDQLPGGATCPPGPPKYYEDPEECSHYWLCVGGCASNKLVRMIHRCVVVMLTCVSVSGGLLV